MKRKRLSFTLRILVLELFLARTFNHWAQDELLIEPANNGLWKIEIPMLTGGKYYYKFLIDKHHWIEDIDNLFPRAGWFQWFQQPAYRRSKQLTCSYKFCSSSVPFI